MVNQEFRMRLPKVGLARFSMSDFVDDNNVRIYGDFFDNGTNTTYTFGRVIGESVYDYSGSNLRWYEPNNGVLIGRHVLYGNIYGINKGYHPDGYLLDDTFLPTDSDLSGNIEISFSPGADGFFVYAVNTSNGYRIRKATLTGDILWTSSVNSDRDGDIYVDREENILVSERGNGFSRYNFSNGSQVWSEYPTSPTGNNAISTSCCSDGSTAFVGAVDQDDGSTEIYKMDMSDGSQLDSVTILNTDDFVKGTIVTKSGNYVICCAGGNVYKIDKSSMSISNTFNNLAVSDGSSSPRDRRVMNDSGGGDSFYVITDNGVEKYDGNNNQVWVANTNGVRGNLYFCDNDVINEAPSEADNFIVQTTPNDKWYMINPSDGSIINTVNSNSIQVCTQGGRLR